MLINLIEAWYWRSSHCKTWSYCLQEFLLCVPVLAMVQTVMKWLARYYHLLSVSQIEIATYISNHGQNLKMLFSFPYCYPKLNKKYNLLLVDECILNIESLKPNLKHHSFHSKCVYLSCKVVYESYSLWVLLILICDSFLFGTSF